jgi:hypothetical protein
VPSYKVGYFVGSLSSKSINRVLARALIRLAPEDLEFTEISIGNLPLYSQDYDDNYPPEATALKEAIHEADAVLFVTPEYNRSIPGALKNAIDLGITAVGQELLPPHPSRGDRGLPGLHRHRRRSAEPAGRAQLLQRPPDDFPGGIHRVLARDLHRHWRSPRRVRSRLPQRLYGRVP